MVNEGDIITTAYRDYKYTGIVLSRFSVKAWAGTIAFNFETNIDLFAVFRHVLRCDALEEKHGLQSCYCGNEDCKRVPVAWEFGKVYWESTHNLELVS